MFGEQQGQSFIGRQMGAYQVISLVGAGGMGEVYEARDAKLQRNVAIKVLPAAFLHDPELVSRLQREARMLAALNHPHIATIYGLEQSDGVHYLVMELVLGKTLAERLKTGPMQVEEALKIGSQIAEALEAAHEKAVIHRDLKPANVKVAPEARVKVLDFGLAKAFAQDGEHDLSNMATLTAAGTEEGRILGTPAYMSPEQARGKPVDKRTDIWAFGCVLYELLTGKKAFPGDTLSDSMAAVLEREPDWQVLPLSTPAKIRDLLRRCLQKDPQRRLRDIGDARIEIEDAMTAPIETEVPSTARGVPIWSAAVAAIIVIALVTALAIVWLRQAAPPDNPLANAQFTRFTDFEGAEMDAAISRDGKYVAFRSDRDGPVDTWVGQIGTGRFLNLTHGAQNTAPVRNMGFTPDTSEIWLAGIIGGTRLRIIPLTGGTARAFLTEHAINAAWSPDGSRIVFHTSDTGDPMFVCDSTGANAQQIFTLGPGGHNHFPTWSVDGQWIYFVSGIQHTREMDIWRIRPSGGTPERLTQHNSNIRYLAPLDRQTVLYVAPDQSGSGPWLWSLDTERKISRRISSGLDIYSSVEASADGHRLVVTVSNPSAKLWSVPLLDRQTAERDVKPFNLPTVRAFAP